MQCKICPMHCDLTVEIDEEDNSYKVSGNKCPQGEKYALQEKKEPSRILFSRVLLDDGPMSRLHVKTDAVIHSHLRNQCIDIIEKTRVKAPVSKGEILIEDILGTGVNVVSTRKVNKI